ncbi:lipopolysaccharide biosynthesis protein [Gordonia aurantiaca]|uniref:lipopolysaccharide biosynthesis protein n=1 Tax=Gordonia sp. B21 TaxID=3151852 RepID=UPI003266D2CA
MSGLTETPHTDNARPDAGAPDSPNTPNTADRPDVSASTSGTGRRHLVKALIAAGWTYGGRAAGLAWTVALVVHLGVGAYGQYAMAFALGAIIAAPLDNPFAVRAIRESEQAFVAERVTRILLGIGLMAVGALCLAAPYLVWFALIVAGGEIVFNAVKSRALRDGHPDRVMRYDTTRQVVSIVAALGYLQFASSPDLTIASFWYLAPYLVIAAYAATLVPGARPHLPGSARLIAILFGEHLANALYMQGDILLLGWLTDSDVAGYFAIASTVGWAAGQVGMSLAGTYHEQLRAAGGAVAAGPPVRHVVVMAAATAALVMVAGFVLLATSYSSELAWSLVVISLFVGLRVMNNVLTTVLYVQRRDLVRSASAAALVPVKLGLVGALATLGAVGASVASVVTDAVLLAVYLRSVRPAGVGTPSPETPEENA